MRLYFLLLIIILSGCSATNLYNRALDKGLKIEPVVKELRFTDTLTVNGKESIIERIVKVDCPEPIIETRWKTRFDYKRFNDSLKHIRHIYADSLKNALKTSKIIRKEQKQIEKTKRTTVRQENKRSLWWLVTLIIGLIIGFFLKFFIKSIVG